MPTRRRESRCGSNHYTTTKTPSLADHSAVHSSLRTGLRAPGQIAASNYHSEADPSEYWRRFARLISRTAFSVSSEYRSTSDLISLLARLK
jgi:hypothetical protein